MILTQQELEDLKRNIVGIYAQSGNTIVLTEYTPGSEPVEITIQE